MKVFWMLFLLSGCSLALADIFEHQRPSDIALREALLDDRAAFYMQTPGADFSGNERRVSTVRSLGVDGLVRPQGLRDLDRSFDLFLREQLNKDRNYQALVANIRPSLLLLEYASPAMADVVKHYRMSAYERLAIEQARLAQIEGAAEGRAGRLGHQSELECLRQNESKGLVAAMRYCQKPREPFDSLVSVDGQTSLQDGRRRIHVVAQGLARLGLEKSRIEKVVALSGEKSIFDDGFEEILPRSTFEGKVALERQASLRQWQEAWQKFLDTQRVTAANLEDLSLPGVPVTVRAFADLKMLDGHERELFLLKLASTVAFFQVRQKYEQAAGYLDLCSRDPGENEEFRGILLEKRDFIFRVMAQADQIRPVVYKELLAALADAADAARVRVQERPLQGFFPVLFKELLVNF